MYPSEWKGSTEPDDISGIATFKIEGVGYSLRLDCFTSYQVVSQMLDGAFDQGKSFSAKAMRGYVIRALDEAEAHHSRHTASKPRRHED